MVMDADMAGGNQTHIGCLKFEVGCLIKKKGESLFP